MSPQADDAAQESDERSSDEDDDDDDLEGGVMMWDDDEQYIPPPQALQQLLPEQPLRPVNNVFADEQRNSLVFSTEELKLEYHRLKFVSKEWSRKDEADIRKTTANLVGKGVLTLPESDEPYMDQARKTMLPEKRAIADLGKNLLRLSLDYNNNGPGDNRKSKKNLIASVGNIKPASMHH